MMNQGVTASGRSIWLFPSLYQGRCLLPAPSGTTAVFVVRTCEPHSAVLGAEQREHNIFVKGKEYGIEHRRNCWQVVSRNQTCSMTCNLVPSNPNHLAQVLPSEGLLSAYLSSCWVRSLLFKHNHLEGTNALRPHTPPSTLTLFSSCCNAPVSSILVL
jgi:hypothetical protein